jgi:hypothetical protein
VTPPAPRPRRRAPARAEAHTPTALAELGLEEGDEVRFRRRPGEHWKPATVVRRERDGSLGVRDAKGALRALPLDTLEVRATGARGARTWEPLPERAARTEQLRLL